MSGVSSHDHAVARFLALVEAAACAPAPTARALARKAGAPPSSAYRAIAALERRGVLARDPSGAYLLGERAVAIGLAAAGLGRYAAACQPVLARLRRDLERAVFFGFLDGEALEIGPYASARGAPFLPARARRRRVVARTPIARGVDRVRLDGLGGAWLLVLDASARPFPPTIGALADWDEEPAPLSIAALEEAARRFRAAAAQEDEEKTP